MGNSFIENINTVANATTLATGDVIEDAQLARDAAVTASNSASDSVLAASAEKDKAQEWATKAYNSPVLGTQDSFSAYHWSIVAEANSGDAVIDDNTVSANTTWSSQLLTTVSDMKSDTTHDHAGVYEPYFSKNSGFNKNFAGTGVLSSVARSDHNHDLAYELLIGPKGTAFNKNFGVLSGDAAEGDHLHDARYMQTAGYIDGVTGKFSSSKMPWVLDPLNPLASELQPGNHRHPADGIDNSGDSYNIAKSNTVQGAIGQLDAQLATITVAEKAKVLAGLSDGASATITNPGINIGTPIDGNLVFTAEKNAAYNLDGIEIGYNNLGDIPPPGSPGTKLVEGQFDTVITIAGVANTRYEIYFAKFDGTTWTKIPTYTAVAGATSNQIATSLTLSLSGWVSGLYDKNATGMIAGDNFKIGVMLESSTAIDTILTSIAMSFAGQPEGALVAAGMTVDHSEITGTGAADGVHTTSDIANLDVELLAKADKVSGAVDGNVATIDASGNLVDSGLTPATIGTDKMNKPLTPTLDNIVTQTSTGDAKDAGVTIADLATVGGSSTQTFEVATATLDTHAVTKATYDAGIAAAATDQDLIDHTALSNPHGTTVGDIGAAPTVHGHTISDVASLQDALDAKYAKVAAPATGNIVSFANGGLLQDTGVASTSLADGTTLVSKSGDTMTGALTATALTSDGAIDAGGQITGNSLVSNNGLMLKAGSTGSLNFNRNSTSDYMGMVWQTASGGEQFLQYRSNTADGDMTFRTRTDAAAYKYVWTVARDTGVMDFKTAPTVNGAEMWTDANDGTGSGLDADKLDGYHATSDATANTVAVRNGAADISARVFKSSYSNASSIPSSAAVCFRNNNSSDQFMRFVTQQGLSDYVRMGSQNYYNANIPDTWILNENVFGDTSVGATDCYIECMQVGRMAAVTMDLRITGFSRTIPSDSTFQLDFNLVATGLVPSITNVRGLAHIDFTATGLDSPYTGCRVYSSNGRVKFHVGETAAGYSSRTATEAYLHSSFVVRW